MVLQNLINKRDRSDDGQTEDVNRKRQNSNKSIIYNFVCTAVLNGEYYRLQLSDVIQRYPYVILFFCGYAFSPETSKDLYHIQGNYEQFIKLGAFPLAVTQDQARIQLIYTTPGSTSNALEFQPSFFLGMSDGVDRLISKAFKSLDTSTLKAQRSIVVIDQNFNILFVYKVPERKGFPMKSIINCLKTD